MSKQASSDLSEERITASEAVFGFMAWVTCRKEPVTLGASCDASIAVELISEWIDANGLPDVRLDVYPDNIVHPKNSQDNTD